MFSFIKWFIEAIPRAPKRAGLLMRIFYFWQENFTLAGHAAASLMLVAMFMGVVPGFWAAWIFCGLDFLFFLALIPCLFLTSKKNKAVINGISVAPVYENETALVSLRVKALNKMDAVSFACFRMHPDIKCIESEVTSLSPNEERILQCFLKVKGRGVFVIPKAALLVPEINGMLRISSVFNAVEILVYPRAIKIISFSFLTSGLIGMVFAPLLMPSLSRGLDFIGVREYREGDSLRDLHHKVFARYGRPFTKEFEVERGAGCVFVLDVSCRKLQEKSLVEPLIRLAAGIGIWLIERGTLGRFFVGDEEFQIKDSRNIDSFLEILARIPRAEIFDFRKKNNRKKNKLWSPAARPMGPVLRLGLFETKDSLVHKQIILTRNEKNTSTDNTFYLGINSIKGKKENQEVSL